MTDPRAAHYLWRQDKLRRLESLTRYPSIPTLHAMDSRGVLKAKRG